MAPNEKTQNVWFGVSMFLIGLIAGVVLTAAYGGKSGGGGTGTGTVQAGTTSGEPAQPTVSVGDRMKAYAADLGLDEGDFEECVGSDKYNTLINNDMNGGSQAGVNGTPGNVIVNMKSKKARLVSGARPFESFKTEIDDLLANPNGTSKDASVTDVTNLPPIDFQKDHWRGTENAEIAIVEYSDYQCPFCQRVHPTYQQLMEAYDGKIVWIYRHFPLSFHPEAMPLAVGAECANELGGQDAFWGFTDKAFGA